MFSKKRADSGQNKDLKQEAKFQMMKHDFHRGIIKLLILGYVFQFIFTVALNPFNRSLSGPKYLIMNSLSFILIILGIYFLRRKSLHIEKYIAVFVLTYLLFLLELKEDMNSVWTKNIFFSTGLLFQFIFLSMPLAKVSWKYSSIVSFILSVFFISRYISYDEDLKSRYALSITSIINFLAVSFYSFKLEKFERQNFLQARKFKQTQKSLKKLVLDVLPSAALIIKNGRIIFTNKKVEKMFNEVDYEEILNETKNIRIKPNLDDNHKDHLFEKKINQNYEEIKLLSKLEDDSEDFRLFDLINQQTYPEFQMYFGAFITTNENFNKSRTKYVDINVSKIMWNDEEGIFLFIHENEIAQKFNELERQAQYKDKLLATVSHDLRTPLNGILGMIKLAIGLITDEIIKEHLLIAERSSQLLLNMINDLLDLSQISNGSLRLNFKEFSILELIEEVSQLIIFQAKHKGLEFKIEKNIDKSSSLIYSDPTRLKQVLLNLLGNALKFTENGFIKISVENSASLISIADSENIDCFEKHEAVLNQGYIIKVEDSGSGIEKEEIPKLFRLFGKLDTEYSKRVNQAGVGLGLSISQNLVKLLNKNKPGYEISVVSEPGQGSCFSFQIQSYLEVTSNIVNECFENRGLKFVQIIPQFEHRNFSNHDVINRKLRKTRILVVEDDQINMIVVTTYLKSFIDLCYDIAHNGCEAVDIVLKKASIGIYYDLILMDCNMPIMDGFQATRKILEYISRENGTPVVIIAMTANASPIDHENCYKSGMKDYISKPFSKEDLSKIIGKYKKS